MLFNSMTNMKDCSSITGLSFNFKNQFTKNCNGFLHLFIKEYHIFQPFVFAINTIKSLPLTFNVHHHLPPHPKQTTNSRAAVTDKPSSDSVKNSVNYYK